MNDHGFNKACPTGNHMLEDKLWIIPKANDSCCDLCGCVDVLKGIDTEDGYKSVCTECYADFREGVC